MPSLPHQLHSPRQKTAVGISPSLCAFPAHASQWLFGDWGVRAGVRAGFWGGSPQDPARSLAWWPPPRSRGGVRASPRLPAYGTLGGRREGKG